MADNKIYITARELSDMLGVSMGYAYKIISGNGVLSDIPLRNNAVS